MRRINYIFIFIVIIQVEVFGQNRIFYVDHFLEIFNSFNSQKKLLEYCKEHHFNALILYDLDKINKLTPLLNTSTSNKLANFISMAKKDYGIKEIAASGENGAFFINVIHKYNGSRKSNYEKFDVYNLEYEYWKEKDSAPNGYYCEEYLKPNGLLCNRTGTFNYFIESLNIMKLLSEESKYKVKVEAYVGPFNEIETEKIVKYIDRILIFAYDSSPKRAYFLTKSRLSYLSKIDSKVQVSILFSAEMNFMGKYFSNNLPEKAEEEFFIELKKDDPLIFTKVNFDGFTYYNYHYFTKSHSKFEYINRQ